MLQGTRGLTAKVNGLIPTARDLVALTRTMVHYRNGGAQLADTLSGATSVNDNGGTYGQVDVLEFEDPKPENFGLPASAPAAPTAAPRRWSASSRSRSSAPASDEPVRLRPALHRPGPAARAAADARGRAADGPSGPEGRAGAQRLVCSALAAITFIALNEAFEGPSVDRAWSPATRTTSTATFADTEALPTKQPVLVRGRPGRQGDRGQPRPPDLEGDGHVHGRRPAPRRARGRRGDGSASAPCSATPTSTSTRAPSAAGARVRRRASARCRASTSTRRSTSSTATAAATSARSSTRSTRRRTSEQLGTALNGTLGELAAHGHASCATSPTPCGARRTRSPASSPRLAPCSASSATASSALRRIVGSGRATLDALATQHRFARAGHRRAARRARRRDRGAARRRAAACGGARPWSASCARPRPTSRRRSPTSARSRRTRSPRSRTSPACPRCASCCGS